MTHIERLQYLLLSKWKNTFRVLFSSFIYSYLAFREFIYCSSLSFFSHSYVFCLIVPCSSSFSSLIDLIYLSFSRIWTSILLILAWQFYSSSLVLTTFLRKVSAMVLAWWICIWTLLYSLILTFSWMFLF